MRLGLRELLFLLMMVGMPLAAWWLAFKPDNEQITAAKQEILFKEQELQKLAAETIHTKDLQSAYEETRHEIDLIESRLPSEKEVEVVLDHVASLARSHNLDLPKVKSKKPMQSALYMEQPLHMEVEGSFDNFYSFLLDLEQMERITRMPSLEIKESKGAKGGMAASFTLCIYFESDKGGGS